MINSIEQIWSWLSDYAMALIALCALFFTAYQTWTTRKHNRLSVKPHLCFFTDNILNDDESTVIATLHNNGLGPALINTYQFYLDGEEIKIEDSEDVKPYFIKVLESENFKHSSTKLGDDYAMKAGEERVILKVSTPFIDKVKIAHWKESLERFDLLINFESMYGVKDTYDSRINRNVSK